MLDGEEPLDGDRLTGDRLAAEAMEQWRGLGEALRELPAYQLPADFADQVWAAASPTLPASPSLPDAEIRRSRRRAWRVVAGIVATTAAGLLVMLSLPLWQDVTPHPETAHQSSAETEASPSATPGAGEFVGTQSPLPAVGRYLMVVDVTLTPKALKDKAFEQTLGQIGIEFDASIQVDPQLEQALLAGRFLNKPSPKQANNGQGPAKGKRQAKTETPATRLVDLVYVVAPAGKIDAAIPAMKQQRDLFPRVKLDLAKKPEQLRVFEQLRRASNAVLVNRTRPARAQRVLLPASFFETRLERFRLQSPHSDRRGLAVAMVPAWLLIADRQAEDRLAPPGSPARDDAEARAERGRKKLAEFAQMESEVLFVVRVESNRDR